MIDADATVALTGVGAITPLGDAAGTYHLLRQVIGRMDSLPDFSFLAE